MNREEIIKLAREAGFVVDEKAEQHQPNCIFHTHHMVDELLERFANLVYESVFRDANIAASATIIDAAVLAEREACARMVDSFDAAAIRARGEK